MTAITLKLTDSRRLTGPGLFWEQPGAIIDTDVAGIDKDKVAAKWQQEAKRLLSAVGWSQEETLIRLFDTGISLAISAPFDALYAATMLNETAWQRTVKQLTGEMPSALSAELAEPDHPATDADLSEQVGRLKAEINAERNPALLALIQAATAYQVPYLTDDDHFSLGYGHHVKTWPVDQLPAPESLTWSDYQTLPLALITGTNGKSTSVRLTAAMVQAQGLACGLTSTDYIRINDTIIDRGDYSGPGGARTLLREPQTEVALLEVARGGLLRRGLPVLRADAALITNIAEDHLGQYGVNDLTALTAAKFIVAKGIDQAGVLILNGDDARLLAYGQQLDLNICWFFLEETHPFLQQHRKAGGRACFLRQADQVLCYAKGLQTETFLPAAAAPLTLNGAAKHNIQNCLGAIGIAKTLGIGHDAIMQGLENFGKNDLDNPGRGNLYTYNGATVVIDFAHNEHGMLAMSETLNRLPAQKKFLMLSHAGDRSDQDISAMTRAALGLKPDYLIAAEVESYLRGRQLGELPAIIIQAAQQAGMAPRTTHCTANPLAGAKQILAQLQPGDLALLMVISEREEIVQTLQAAGQPSSPR